LFFKNLLANGLSVDMSKSQSKVIQKNRVKFLIKANWPFFDAELVDFHPPVPRIITEAISPSNLNANGWFYLLYFDQSFSP